VPAVAGMTVSDVLRVVDVRLVLRVVDLGHTCHYIPPRGI